MSNVYIVFEHDNVLAVYADLKKAMTYVEAEFSVSEWHLEDLEPDSTMDELWFAVDLKGELSQYCIERHEIVE